MKKYNYIVSVIMLAISGYIFYEISGYETGSSAQKSPDVWPGFLAACLAVLSIALIIETLFKKEEKPAGEAEEPQKIIDWTGEGMKKVYIMFALLAAFVVVMKFLGMLGALLLLIPALEWLMGCRNKLMLVALPVGLVVFCYVFFCIIMKITLPEPIWM